MPEQTSTAQLAGLGIVVTRPAHQAEELCTRIASAGGHVIRFPVLEILDPLDSGPLIHLIDSLDTFDFAIFISPNAVHKVLNLIKARRDWPANVRIAAIGAKSSRAIEQFGLPVEIRPDRRFNSEALLETELFKDMSDRRVIIFRGDGGRELLGDTLRARGAEVIYANAYRRAKPQSDRGELLYHWSRGEVSAVMVTSTEGLHNLFDMVGKLGQMWLRKTPLILGSNRIAETASELGHQLPPIVASDPSDEAMFDALIYWVSHRNTT